MIVNFKATQRNKFRDLIDESIIKGGKRTLNDFSSEDYYNLCVNCWIMCYPPQEQANLIESATKKVTGSYDMSVFTGMLIMMAHRCIEFEDLDEIPNPSCVDEFWFNDNVKTIKIMIIESVKEYLASSFYDELFELQKDLFYDSCISTNNIRKTRAKGISGLMNYLKESSKSKI